MAIATAPDDHDARERRIEIAERFAAVGLDGLTIDDVLTALAENGISDLRSLIARQIEAAKAEELVQLPADPWAEPSEAARGGTLRPHKTPEVPVEIDGTLYDPRDIHRFDGQALHFVGPSSAEGCGSCAGAIPLRAFTGRRWPAALQMLLQVQWAAGILHHRWLPGTAAVPQRPAYEDNPCNYNYRPSEFFEHVGYGGGSFLVRKGYQVRDLTRSFLARSWNDRISSVRPDPNTYTVLCDHINLGGSSFTVSDNSPSLVPFGWNDRASSVVCWKKC
ncbi:MAG: hypothetical protein RLZZ187_827 [Pseudomonadota bacterium]